MTVNIRPAIPNDAEALSQIAFSAKSHWGYPDRWMEIWRPQFDFSPEYIVQNECWVADFNNKPVAFYTLQEKNDHAWIENLWVLPERIGQGIGKQLFLHAVSHSRLKGHLVLRLEADPNAVGFYEKMGMYRIGERSYPFEGETRALPVMEIEL